MIILPIYILNEEIFLIYNIKNLGEKRALNLYLFEYKKRLF
jgi:hypothetical protein